MDSLLLQHKALYFLNIDVFINEVKKYKYIISKYLFLKKEDTFLSLIL